MKVRWLVGVFAFGSLVACMVPDVTEKSDPCGPAGCGQAQSQSSNPGSSTSLQAAPGSALPSESSEAETSGATAHKADAGGGATADAGTTTPPNTSTQDAGTSTSGDDDDDTTDSPSCDKLIDCCVALRSAGRDSDADSCDTTYTANDDLSCFEAQDGWANPTDGTTGVCDQP